MKRLLLLLLLVGGCIPSMAQNPSDNQPPSFSPRFQHPQRPDFPPSYTIHILPTQKEVGTSMWSAPNYWITQGYELRKLVGMLYDFDVACIDFSDRELARKRYDVAIVPPVEMGEAMMMESIRTALQNELGLLIAKETQRRAVYIVTAPNGPGPALRATTDMGGFTATSSLVTVPIGTKTPTMAGLEQLQHSKKESEGIAVDLISITSGTIPEFCSTLEQSLDRPVVDESHLQGTYAINLRRETMTRDHFFDRIRKELGLVVLPGEREVAKLVVRPN